MLAIFDRLSTLSVFFDDEEFGATLSDFYFLHGGILLFGAKEVTDAMGTVVEVLQKMGESMSSGSEAERAARWRSAWQTYRRELTDAQGMLISAMRQDVTRGLLPE
jgi:hypothetical protein